MKPGITLFYIFLAVGKCSFGQDTTGGTTPNLVIPLHRAHAKTGVPPTTRQQKVYSPKNPTADDLPLNATDRKLRIAAAAAKHKKTYGRKARQFPAKKARSQKGLFDKISGS